MRHQSIIIVSILTTLFFVSCVRSNIAQTKKDADQWLRVFTEEDSTIEVDRTSLVLEQDQIIKAKFKTTLENLEPLVGKPGVKYKIRFDSIQFSVKNWKYRIIESTFLDTSEKVVFSSASNAAEDWNRLRGRTANRLFRAATQLSPFGMWKVFSYRYANGDLPSNEDPSELKTLVGTYMWLQWNNVQTGDKSCRSPIFEPGVITSDDLMKRVGSSLNALGITSNKIEAIVLRCENNNQFPSQTFILRLRENKGLMLWEGVFFEIERGKNLFSP